uniref:Late blight resistance protein homolog R1B-23 n=3 Tax=Nicotiana sylvestris TaxID=4096 RepID=A0A1U7X8M6_NICSY|nr:PREDICTED: putative late blight resistance protein homolog R1B-23 [Nicotiana sylvestris]
MADAVRSFFVENLLQIISENVKLIAGTKGQLELLVEEVKTLNAFLDEAAKTQSDNKLWKQFIKDIRITVYKAEDIIDKFLVQAKLHADKNFVKRGFDYNYAGAVKELGEQVGIVLQKVKKLREDNKQAFQPTPVSARVPHLEDAEVVGFDKEAETVIKRLVEGSDELEVIPVVGMAGLGKSTLAIKIYNDSKISYEFFSNIWVYVGQNYKLKEVLLSILKSFTKQMNIYQDKNENELCKIICDFVSKGGKCLIVLDDVCNPEVVDSVMKAFPKNKKGHRIMMTTREGRVAKYANENPHNLKFLEHHESFELLEKRVFGNRSCHRDLVAHGKTIAEKCSGVPLAVVVIAGALRGRTSEGEWQIVEQNVGKYLIDQNNPTSNCLKFVEMSYSRLPEDMKACFLYCSAFPQGFEIPAWKLIRLWISEGLIISNLPGSTLENIAEYILNDLVNRNLLIILEKKADGKIKTCRLHDMLHMFCKLKATDESLFQEVGEKPDQVGLGIPEQDTCRRLCIQLSILDDFISTRPMTEHTRSFLCFSSKQKKTIELTTGNIRNLHKAFPLIRVLEVERIKFGFSKEFNALFHLRYIAISGDFESIPQAFGKFWNLQTVILNTSTSKGILDINADIWNMLRLRHLHTNVPAKLPSPSSTPTSKHSCLQTLSKVAPESCRKDVLARACNLRKLCIQGQMVSFFETSKGGFSNFGELKCLEHLKLLNDVLSKDLHLPPTFFGFLRNLKKLTLSKTQFEWSEANRLAQLECLEVLKLKENAFIGTSWESEIGGFSLPKVLWIDRADLKSWKVSNAQFQNLKNLVLKSCVELEAVPIELADVRSLQEMRLENTIKAIKSAKEIELKKQQAPQSSKFKLTIFPPESTDSKATQ